MNTDPTLHAPAPVVDPGFDPLRRRLLVGAALVGAAFVAEPLLSACGKVSADSNPRQPMMPSHPESGDPSPDSIYAFPPKHEGMVHSTDLQLHLLSTYEDSMEHGFDSMLLFTGMPRNAEEARSQAKDMTGRLLEWDKFGVKPVVVMEPTFDGGAKKADLTKLHSQEYIGDQGVLDVYFQTLKNAGITDEQMGTWVPYPEPNIPEWDGGVTDPATFRANFTGAAQRIKTHFGGAKVSIMLDSTSYPSGNVAEDQGTTDTNKLLEYVTGIPQDPSAPLVDSFGLQGFPWNLNDDPKDYLNARAAMACAARLGVKDIWLNTGSFATLKNGNDTIHADQSTRANALEGEFDQAVALKKAGFNVKINIFAQKQGDVDWSYNQDATTANLFGSAMNLAAQAGIEASFFDAPN